MNSPLTWRDLECRESVRIGTKALSKGTGPFTSPHRLRCLQTDLSQAVAGTLYSALPRALKWQPAALAVRPVCQELHARRRLGALFVAAARVTLRGWFCDSVDRCEGRCVESNTAPLRGPIHSGVHKLYHEDHSLISITMTALRSRLSYSPNQSSARSTQCWSRQRRARG